MKLKKFLFFRFTPPDLALTTSLVNDESSESRSSGNITTKKILPPDKLSCQLAYFNLVALIAKKIDPACLMKKYVLNVLFLQSGLYNTILIPVGSCVKYFQGRFLRSLQKSASFRSCIHPMHTDLLLLHQEKCRYLL